MKNVRFVVALVLAAGAPGAMGQLVRQGAGANAAAIQTVVDQFRSDLGGLNPNQTGSFGAGRREINWDGVPDTASAPNLLPANFFNANSPRGLVYSGPGTGFAVSAKDVNPTNTPARFGDINPAYATTFAAFSPQRLFTTVGSNITDVNFFVAGTNQPALVSGFGAVFTDVDLATSTRIDYYGANDQLLLSQAVPAAGIGSQTQSFLGVSFGASLVARVQIYSGNAAFGAGVNDNPAGATPVDLVAMDDFIYGEPVPAPGALALASIGTLVGLRRCRR